MHGTSTCSDQSLRKFTRHPQPNLWLLRETEIHIPENPASVIRCRDVTPRNEQRSVAGTERQHD